MNELKQVVRSAILDEIRAHHGLPRHGEPIIMNTSPNLVSRCVRQGCSNAVTARYLYCAEHVPFGAKNNQRQKNTVGFPSPFRTPSHVEVDVTPESSGAFRHDRLRGRARRQTVLIACIYLLAVFLDDPTGKVWSAVLLIVNCCVQIGLAVFHTEVIRDQPDIDPLHTDHEAELAAWDAQLTGLPQKPLPPENRDVR